MTDRVTPSFEQVAWATMVVGEMNLALGEKDRVLRSYRVTMELARWLAIREAETK